MTLSGFEPTIPASEGLQTYALDRATTGTGAYVYWLPQTHGEGGFLEIHTTLVRQLLKSL
jgi:hypothetical protein